MHSARTTTTLRFRHLPGRNRLRAGAAGLLATAALLGSTVQAFAATSSPTPSPSASGAAGAAGTPTTKTPTVTFGLGPTAPAGSSERPYFSFGVTPGAQAADHVTIVNFSSTPLTITVYPVQATNTDTGAVGFGAASETPADIASWLSVGATRPVVVTVPGRPSAALAAGHVTLPIKLTVPLDAQPGDHVGGIVASLNVLSTKPDGERVTLEQRVVSRVYVRVSGPLHPGLQILNVHTSYHSKDATFGAGSMSVSYTVKNTGNVRLAASQSVAVSGVVGGSKKVNPGNIIQLLPGGTSAVSVVVPSVLPLVVVRPHITIKPAALPGDVDPALKPVSYRKWVPAVPWGEIAALVILALIFWWRRRGRGRTRPVAVTAHTPTPPSPPAVAPRRAPRVGAQRRTSKHGR